MAISYTFSAVFIRLRVLNPPDYMILDKRVFKNFKLADEPFSKALRILETCLTVNNNLWVKLVLTLEFPIKFHEKIQRYFISIFF